MKGIARILGTARELWSLYIGIIVASTATAATALLAPFIIAQATQTIVDITTKDSGGIQTLVWLAVALFAVLLTNTLATNVGGYFGDMMAARLRVLLSQRFYAKLLRMPQRYFDSELTGTLISRLDRSITSITDFLKMFSNSLFTVLITVVAVLVVAGIHSPWLAVLLVLIYPVFIWLTALTSRRWQRFETAKNLEYDVAGGRFAEVIGQMRVVKSFASEKRELDYFKRRYGLTVDLTRGQSRFWHRMDVLRRAALDVVFFALYLIIFVQTARGVFTIGAMVLLVQLINMAKDPITMMSWFIDSAQRAITGSHDYFRVMNEPEEPQQEGAASPLVLDLAPGTEAIRFDGVSFGYDNELVVRDIDLAVKSGERIAFVAESGGGKTTLVNLLMKLYQPTSGSIQVGGHRLGDVQSAAVRQEIGVVFQDASLFSGTIRENIAYGRPEATDDQLREAARRANAIKFIDKLPGGFDTEIGERGIKLSGGQKQRIAVARAMLKDAPILVLDEATSALDTKAERQVQAGLEELMVGRTTLIIAHRLSTISEVDRIVTLRDGVIDEIGSPEELAATDGIYAELLALQGSTAKADRARLRNWDIIR